MIIYRVYEDVQDVKTYLKGTFTDADKAEELAEELRTDFNYVYVEEVDA